jgi:hypothetical protein
MDQRLWDEARREAQQHLWGGVRGGIMRNLAGYLDPDQAHVAEHNLTVDIYNRKLQERVSRG